MIPIEESTSKKGGYNIKKKIFSIFCALVVVVSFSLVTAVPVAVSAADPAYTFEGSAIEVISHEPPFTEQNEGAFIAEPHTTVVDDVAFDAQTCSQVVIEGEVSDLNLGAGWPSTAYVEIGLRPEATMSERNAGVYLIAFAHDATTFDFHLQDYTGQRPVPIVNIAKDLAPFTYKITLTPDGTAGGTATFQVWDKDKTLYTGGEAPINYGEKSTWQENVPEVGGVVEDFTNAHLFYSIIADRRGDAGQDYSATVGAITIDDTLYVGEGQDFTTIQEAIDSANPGDTIDVAAGTYDECLNVNKSVNIVGAGVSQVTINTSGLEVNNAGIYVSADNVLLQGFTQVGNQDAALPRYGVKFADVSGGSVMKVLAKDNFRTGFDFLGTMNTTVSDIASRNNGGHGIQLCDCTDITLSNITVSENGWEGVNVATLGEHTPLGTSGIVFSGTNSFGDVFQLEEGDYENSGVAPAGEAIITYSTDVADSADVTVQDSDFGYALHGDQDDGPDQNRVWFFETLAEAQAEASSAPVGHFDGNGIYIESLTDRTQLYVSPGCEIQAAIDGASPLDTIDVAAGTYKERIVIEKELVIQSTDGVENTIIDGNGVGNNVVNIWHKNVTFEGFTVTNPTLGAYPDAGGIYVQDPSNSDASLVNNVHVLNNIVEETKSASVGTSSYGPAGIIIGPSSDVTVSGNIIRNLHNCPDVETDHTSGINVWGNDAASMPFNIEISGNVISDTDDYGIQLEYAHNVQIEDNSITECEVGIRVAPFLGATVSDLTVNLNNFADNSIQVFDGAEVLDIQEVLDTNDFDRAVTVDHDGASLLPTIWSSIQDGIGAAVDDDTVIVAAGVYSEWQDNGSGASAGNIIDKPLHLQGIGDDCIIRGKTGTAYHMSSSPIFWVKADNVEIDHFKFDGATVTEEEPKGLRSYGISSAWKVDGVDYAATNLNVHHNTFVFIGTAVTQDRAGGGDITVAYNTIVRETRSIWYDPAGADPGSYVDKTLGGGGVTFFHVVDGSVHDNTGIETPGVGIALYFCEGLTIGPSNVVSAPNTTDPSDEGIHIQGCSNIVITGNTISNFTCGEDPYYNHGKKGAGIWISGGCDGITIKNNNLRDNTVGVYAGTTAASSSPTNVKINNNNIEDNADYGVLNIKYPASNPWTYWDYELFSAADANINATNNWWNSASGPTHTGNTFNVGEQGDAVSDLVDFVPWLDALDGESFAPVTTEKGPFCSIQAAIDDADPSQHVNVKAGFYNPTAPIAVTESVTITGDIATPSNVVVNAPTSGTDRDCFQIVADAVTIQGFKIQGAKDVASGSGDGWQNAGVMIGNDVGTLMDRVPAVGIQNTTISYNEITDCSYGIYHYRAQHTTISYNKIHACTQDLDHWTGKGIQLYGEYSANETQDYDIDILDNEIYDNELMGIELNYFDTSEVWVDADVLIDHNIIYNNGGSWESVWIWGGGGKNWVVYRGISANGKVTGVTINNNELYNHGSGTGVAFRTDGSSGAIRVASCKGWTITNNNIHDNMRGIHIYDGEHHDLSNSNTGHVITGNNIHGNAQGIATFRGDVGSAHLNNIHDNDVTTYMADGVGPCGAVNLGEGTFDATNNWWSNPNGPSAVAFDFYPVGDAVSGNVAYDPWHLKQITGLAGLAVSNPTESSVDLFWTTTGAWDGDYFDVRYSTSAITSENWKSAKRVTGEPTPATTVNTPQGMRVHKLRENTTYYFGLKLIDKGIGSSDISNIVSDSTLTTTTAPTDTTPPSAITDLKAAPGTPPTKKVILNWTAKGDNGIDGIASKYIIKRSTSEITADNFDSATTVHNNLRCKSNGESESFTVRRLTPNTTYYFAIKIQDEVPNTSDISTVVNITTGSLLTTITDISPETADNGAPSTLDISGTNFTSSGTTVVRLISDDNAFRLPNVTYVSETLLTAVVPIGAPTGTYQARVINNHGRSALSSATYIVTAAPTPLPVVTNLIPQMAASDTAVNGVKIFGKNFTDVIAVKFGDTEATSFTVISDTKITADVPELTVGEYDVKVTTSDAGTNSISAVKFKVSVPVVFSTDTTEDTTTSEMIDLDTNEIPVQITLTTDTSETATQDTDTDAEIEVVIPPQTKVRDSKDNDYTGNIHPPRVVKPDESELTDLADNAVVIEMGNPEETIHFDQDFVATITITADTEPVIWYYNKDTEAYELAGKTGTKDGVDYVPGGTKLGQEDSTYTMGLLLDHMSSYVAGVEPRITSAPATVTAGSAFTITGTNFHPAAKVYFSDTAGTIVSCSTTQIVARFSTAGSHTLRVENPDELSDTTSIEIASPPPSPPAGGGGGGDGYEPPAPPPGTTDVRGKVTTTGRFRRSVTATSEDELCTLTIPKDTVGLTEELEPLDEITILEMDDPPPPPEDAHVVGLAYDFGPDGATFDPPITLEYTYDPADIPEGVVEGLFIAYYDEEAGEWVELEGCVVDAESKTITAPVSHFTTFAIIVSIPPPPPAPAAFSVTNLLVVKSLEIQPKEAVIITVSVANTGGTEGSYTVVLKIDGVKEEEKRVTVAAGRSQSVSFSVSREDAGTYNIAVDGLSASFTVVAPEAPPPVVVPAPPPAPTAPPVVVPAPPPALPAPSPINWPVLGGIIAAVLVAVALLIFFLVRRRA